MRMSKEATVPKITESFGFLQDMGNAGGGTHVPGHICHCPL